MFYQHHMDTAGWVFMAVANIVIWGLVLVFIVWLVQDLRTRRHRDHVASGRSASEILDRRLASGEIDVAEYQRLRTTLGQPSSTQPSGPGSTHAAPA